MGRDTICSRRRLPRLNSFASSLIAVTEFRVAFPMTTAESLRLRPRCRSRSRCRETRRSGCSRSSRSWSQVSSENAQDVSNDVTKNSPQENSPAILRLFSRQSGKTKKARSRHKVGSGGDLRGMTLDRRDGRKFGHLQQVLQKATHSSGNGESGAGIRPRFRRVGEFGGGSVVSRHQHIGGTGRS